MTWTISIKKQERSQILGFKKQPKHHIDQEATKNERKSSRRAVSARVLIGDKTSTRKKERIDDEIQCNSEEEASEDPRAEEGHSWRSLHWKAQEQAPAPFHLRQKEEKALQEMAQGSYLKPLPKPNLFPFHLGSLLQSRFQLISLLPLLLSGAEGGSSNGFGHHARCRNGDRRWYHLISIIVLCNLE